jgi:uncharacterized protein
VRKSTVSIFNKLVKTPTFISPREKLMLTPITSIYASFLALFIVILMFPVIRLRGSLRVGLGDGGQRSLQQAIRAHGNAVEVIPIFLILLAVYELNRASPVALHTFGAIFLVVRLLHVWGLYSSAGSSFGRVAGTAGSIGVLITLAAANIIKALS